MKCCVAPVHSPTHSAFGHNKYEGDGPTITYLKIVPVLSINPKITLLLFCSFMSNLPEASLDYLYSSFGKAIVKVTPFSFRNSLNSSLMKQVLLSNMIDSGIPL